MKYSDELDRTPGGRMSRRQFLTSGGTSAAGLAAGALVPAAGRRLLPTSPPAPGPDDSLGDQHRGGPDHAS